MRVLMILILLISSQSDFSVRFFGKFPFNPAYNSDVPSSLNR